MSIDLRSHGESYRMSHDLWQDFLILAECKGWAPAGTKANLDLLRARMTGQPAKEVQAVLAEAEEYGAGYFQNDGQIIQAEDAHKLGAALKDALDDIPEFDIVSPTNIFEKFAGFEQRRHLWSIADFFEYTRLGVTIL